MIFDPELLAVAGSLGLATLLSARGLRRARRVSRACTSCGRRIVHGVRTCECELRERL